MSDYSIRELPANSTKIRRVYILTTRCGNCRKLKPDKRAISTPSHTEIYVYLDNSKTAKETANPVECMEFKCVRKGRLSFVAPTAGHDCLSFEA